MTNAAVHPVDVIIPTRNRASLTAEAIRSVQAQGHQNWRAVVVDDASDDGSRDQIATVVRSDPRVQLVEQPRASGPAHARQAGLDKGTAPWVAPLDSDDLWLPEKLERQLAAILDAGAADTRIGAVLCGHQWVALGSEVSPTRVTLPPPFSASPIVSDNMSTPLLARELLTRAGGFLPQSNRELKNSEHIECYIRWSQHLCFIGVQELLVLCRSHRDSRQSDSVNSVDAAESLAMVYSSHESFLTHHQPDCAAQIAARIGARFLAAGRTNDGVRWFQRALRTAGSPSVQAAIVRRYGPFIVRTMAVRMLRRLESPRASPQREVRPDDLP